MGAELPVLYMTQYMLPWNGARGEITAGQSLADTPAGSAINHSASGEGVKVRGVI